MFSWFSSKNSILSGQVVQNEFEAMGVFASIHCYFRDKYQKDVVGEKSLEDFNCRAEHFFAYLAYVLKAENNAKPPVFKGYSKQYVNLLKNIVNNHFGVKADSIDSAESTDEAASKIKAYLFEAARLVSEQNPNEQLFYRHFLKTALPCLQEFDAGLAQEIQGVMESPKSISPQYV